MGRRTLAGKTVLVTGGRGRVGPHLVAGLHEAGARVVVGGRDVAATRAAFAHFESAESALDFVTMDVTRPESLAAALSAVLERHGGVDCLVNNAGTTSNALTDALDVEAWDRVMAVNVRGPFLCSRTFMPALADSADGSIINIGSIYGLVAPDPRIYGDTGRNSSVVYGASKAALLQMTRHLAVEWAPKGIRVNCLTLGGVANNQQPDFLERYGERTPMARMANPEELKGAIVFLASDASSYMTGQNLVLDGGWTAW